jgi:hypothetical protein
MPLFGYMKTSDPGRIASINNVAEDKSRRKRIITLEGTSKELYVQIMVRDCETHDPPGAVVPVELFEYVPGGAWRSLGTAQCCPLCWRIIRPPKGSFLPKPKKQVLAKPSSPKQKAVLRRTRTTRTKEGVDPRFERRQKLLKWAEHGKDFDTQDVMTVLGISRPTAIQMLALLVRGNFLVVTHQGNGRGDRTTHRKAP